MIEEDDRTIEGLPGLPEELRDLDAELRDIRLEERPSFAPELLAELEQTWLRAPEEPDVDVYDGRLRKLVAATVGAVLLVGLTVPPARASLAEFSRMALASFGVIEREADRVPPEPTTLSAPPMVAPDPPSAIMEPVPEPAVRDLDPLPVRKDPERVSFVSNNLLAYPTLIDREAAERASRRYYTEDLRQRAAHGIVGLSLFVDSAGEVAEAFVTEGSGDMEIDDVALRAALDLRFVPTRRGGRPVGAWRPFQIEVGPPLANGVPELDALSVDPRVPEGLDLGEPDPWTMDAVVSPPPGVPPVELLRASLEDPEEVVGYLGPLDGLLRGEPSGDASLLRWRAEAVDALELAIARDPENPAPYLALGRILKKQGAKDRALRLFENGILQAERGGSPGSPELFADLQYERGLLLEEEWLAWKDLGRLDLEGLEPPRCGGLATHHPITEESLIPLNYVCPEELERLFEEGFRPASPPDGTREAVHRAFREAAVSEPGHVGAHVELLLERVAQERWYAVFQGARALASASDGAPEAFLLSGVALHGLGRSAEAMRDFRRAFEKLPAEDVAALLDIRTLMRPDAAHEFGELDGAEREEAAAAFWARLDPLRGTNVNERMVEHVARGVQALLRFGGLDTDAGRVAVRYGVPRDVWAVGVGSDLRLEFWTYGRPPYLTFLRPARSAEPELTSEAIEYLDDLEEPSPHWYRSPWITTLPTQAARFRAPGDGQELELRAQIPGDLRTRDEDNLMMGVFALDSDDRVLAESIAPAEGRDIDVVAPVPEGAERVLLEVWNPTTGRAATVRIPVPETTSEADLGRVSDLLLVEAARPPTSDVSRHDPWVRPIASRRISARFLGVLFELYGMGSDRGTYWMTAEAVPAGGGDPIALRHRPAGQGNFVEAWARSPDSESEVTGEYLTLDLAPLPPGRYKLRVKVELPHETMASTSTSVFERTKPENDRVGGG